MVAGKLEVEISANTQNLEAGLQRSQQQVNQTAGEMNKAGGRMAGWADKTAKAFAFIGAVDIGVKSINAGLEIGKGILAAMNGDAEGMNKAFEEMSNLAKSLPFGLGSLASSIESLAASLMGVAEAQAEVAKAQEELARVTRIVEAYKAGKKEILLGNEALKDRLAIAQSEDQWARQLNEANAERRRMLEDTLRLEEEIAEAIGKKQWKRADDLKQLLAERRDLIEQITLRERELVYQAFDRAEEEERMAKAAERALKAKQAQEKLEKERLAREKEMQRLADERMAAEKEMLEAQQAAQEGLAGATGTVSTAAGSFTVGIDAQLNETKLMRSVSEKSRDILHKIAETLEWREKQPLMM